MRLGSHIYKKFSSHDEEDARYSKWRAGWGKHWKIYSYGKVFLLQGFLLLLVAMPILLISRYSSGEWSIINTIGILVWIFGFTFEVVGDRQLKSFIKSRDRNTGNQIMKKGLWKYSRHPNYFGEAVLWWGIFLIAFGVDYFYLAIIGPITIFLLLRFVSGVPMAEERYGENIEFQEYKRKTPAMFPNFFIK
ncbi:steroid 5-alpha reductase [Candidatus Parcubacteria bacterium]|nr:MAG: steroid 5-alpha reductase [Candidatus Parcubacteria bacterium]